MVKHGKTGKLIVIEDIIYYGRCYDCKKELWWFSRTDNSVVSIEEIKSVYGWSTTEQILAQSLFFPLFKTDMIQLEKEYMKNFKAGSIEAIMEDKKVSYHVAFNIFVETPVENFHRWKEYEKKQLVHDAVIWCKANGLPYKMTC